MNVWHLCLHAGVLISSQTYLQQVSFSGCLKHISRVFALTPVSGSSMKSIPVFDITRFQLYMIPHMLGCVKTAVHQPFLCTLTAWRGEELSILQLDLGRVVRGGLPGHLFLPFFLPIRKFGPPGDISGCSRALAPRGSSTAHHQV